MSEDNRVAEFVQRNKLNFPLLSFLPLADSPSSPQSLRRDPQAATSDRRTGRVKGEPCTPSVHRH